MDFVDLDGAAEQAGFADLKFGTSGLRGTVAAMSDRACYCYVRGFLQYLEGLGEFGPGRQVALAGDLRPSTPRILAACVQAIRDAGGEAVFCGYVPTPALAFFAMRHGMASLMVTGSHIPDDRNGIKFYRAQGEVLKDDEAGILRQRVPCDPALFDATNELRTAPRLPETQDVKAIFVRRYFDFFGEDALAGMRIGIYQHSAVGRDLMVEIVEALGGEAARLGRSERFVPVDTEAIRPEDVELARNWAAGSEFDAIISTDGDGDRPLIADSSGNWLRGDVVGVLCARHLGADCVVTPVSSNTIVEKCGSFPRIERTRIGSPYVIAAMEQAREAGCERVCGYEANGGFLLGSDVDLGNRRLGALPTRDAVLPILAILVAARPGTIAGLVAALPARFTHSDRIKDFPVERSMALMGYLSEGGAEDTAVRAQALFGKVGGTLSGIDLTDGFRVTFENACVIHIRPSGNAPELRCYTEADTAAKAGALCEETLAILREPGPWQ